MSGAPIWSGDDEVPEPADREGHHAEEDHDGAVHRPELVVELGQHGPAGHARIAEDLPERRQRGAWIGELPAHQHHQREAKQEEQQACDGVLDPDDLVVGGEDVRTPEAERLVMGLVRAVRFVCGDSAVVTHAAVLRPVTSWQGWRI